MWDFVIANYALIAQKKYEIQVTLKKKVTPLLQRQIQYKTFSLCAVK